MKGELKEVSINRFDPKVIEKRRTTAGPPTCVFIGKRGTGKSTLVADILYQIRKIPIGCVISATEDGNHFYEKFVPPIFIHSRFDPNIIEKIVQRQKSSVKSCPENAHAFLLLDDMMYDKKVMKDRNITEIFMNGRHWKLLFLLTMQYCMGIGPDLRTNVDFVFCLRENVVDNQKKLWQYYFGIFPTFDQFRQVMNTCTEGWDAMVLDNTSKSTNIEDCVFWYRANPNRNFRIGSPELWKYNKHNLEKEDAKEKKSAFTEKIPVRVNKVEKKSTPRTQAPKK
tara:strand:+ start:783 stop:1628 length:846 start_codon:yes stop_codon:yes gene_type:complete